MWFVLLSSPLQRGKLASERKSDVVNRKQTLRDPGEIEILLCWTSELPASAPLNSSPGLVLSTMECVLDDCASGWSTGLGSRRPSPRVILLLMQLVTCPLWASASILKCGIIIYFLHTSQEWSFSHSFTHQIFLELTGCIKGRNLP